MNVGYRRKVMAVGGSSCGSSSLRRVIRMLHINARRAERALGRFMLALCQKRKFFRRCEETHHVHRDTSGLRSRLALRGRFIMTRCLQSRRNMAMFCSIDAPHTCLFAFVDRALDHPVLYAGRRSHRINAPFAYCACIDRMGSCCFPLDPLIARTGVDEV